MQISELNHQAEFVNLVGHTFRVGEDMKGPDITLDRVEPIANGQREGGSFSALFLGPQDFVLEQGFYQLSGATIAFNIFLVPVGPEGDQSLYEAVYN